MDRKKMRREKDDIDRDILEIFWKILWMMRENPEHRPKKGRKKSTPFSPGRKIGGKAARLRGSV